ncbi:neuropeptide Y receptor-like [Tropilaelaps mercedesae]|uniref:Neuropeptide Y receptor-like n=1 Tax=Tropilaelaps mercedesae TaxID=418985 RepID=A0A1V9XSN2_9ACAR|nr:neuropeptide Y receptor-like [Tropilaelaps mercedesae]
MRIAVKRKVSNNPVITAHAGCVAICSTSLSQQIIPQYRVRRVIALIWTFSLLLMSPIAVYQDLVQATPDVPWCNCVDNYPSQKFRVVFNAVALFACCYVLPLVIITATYILIFVTVWKRSIPGECLNKMSTEQQDGNRTMAQRSKLKVFVITGCGVRLCSLYGQAYYNGMG